MCVQIICQVCRFYHTTAYHRAGLELFTTIKESASDAGAGGGLRRGATAPYRAHEILKSSRSHGCVANARRRNIFSNQLGRLLPFLVGPPRGSSVNPISIAVVMMRKFFQAAQRARSRHLLSPKVLSALRSLCEYRLNYGSSEAYALSKALKDARTRNLAYAELSEDQRGLLQRFEYLRNLGEAL